MVTRDIGLLLCIITSLVGCGGVTTSEPCPIPDAGIDSSVVDPCAETDRSIVVCLRALGPTDWTASGECKAAPTKVRMGNTVPRSKGRQGCVTLQFTTATEPESVLCCPD